MKSVSLWNRYGIGNWFMYLYSYTCVLKFLHAWNVYNEPKLLIMIQATAQEYRNHVGMQQNMNV